MIDVVKNCVRMAFYVHSMAGIIRAFLLIPNGGRKVKFTFSGGRCGSLFEFGLSDAAGEAAVGSLTGCRESLKIIGSGAASKQSNVPAG